MSRSKPGPWGQEIDELAQSVTRALIFGIALIYTMESWWVGEYLDIWKLLVFFFVAFLVNMYLLPVATKMDLSFWEIFRKSARNKGRRCSRLVCPSRSAGTNHAVSISL